MFAGLKKIWRLFGPGLVTGAADDDPSGIATYSQTGALFGYSQLWLALFSFPFMTTVQEMCGRIGMVTGDGLAGIMRKHYSRTILWCAVLLLLFANVINIGADLGAMAAAVLLLVPLPFTATLIAIALISIVLQILVPYPSYAAFLKYVAFSLLAYIIAAFFVTLDWASIVHATFVPHFAFTKAYVLNIAAFLGTTISPYLFFWQADEEVEEEIEQHKTTDIGAKRPRVNATDIKKMRVDTAIGMLFSNTIAFFIMIVVAATLGMSGMHEIASAADAASALRPVAGEFAFLLFAIGILGTGFLAVPVLAGSIGYAMAEALGWKAGLGKRFGQARGFYVVIALATLIGLVVNFLGVPPMQVLYYSAMLNGVLAPPLMAVILVISNSKKIMGAHVNGPISNTLGVIILALMSIVGVATIAALFV